MLTFQPVSAHPSGNCHLLCSGEDAILIDASISFCGEETAAIAERALRGHRLFAILLSHSHYDHTTGLWWLHRTFPGVPVLAHPAAIQNFARPGARSAIRALCRNAATLYTGDAERGFLPEESFSSCTPCADGQEIPFGRSCARILFTPGHTRDSLSVDFPGEGVLWLCETLGFWDGRSDGAIQPCYLSGYQDTLDSIGRMSALLPRRLILTHSRMLDEAGSASFLPRSREVASGCAERILRWHDAGLSLPEMLRRYEEVYHDEKCADLQPMEAFRINAEATIRVTLRELRGAGHI